MTKTITICDCCKQECKTKYHFLYERSRFFNLAPPRKIDLCLDCFENIKGIIESVPSEDNSNFDKAVDKLKAKKFIKKN